MPYIFLQKVNKFKTASNNIKIILWWFYVVLTLSNIEHISCGQHHTIAVAKDGNFYAFGDNKYGQLGINTDIFSKTLIPIKLSDFQFKLPFNLYSGWSHVIVLKSNVYIYL